MSGEFEHHLKKIVAPALSRKKPKGGKRSFTFLPAEIRRKIYKLLSEDSMIEVANLMDDEIEFAAPVVRERSY